jgi:CubicO group peptidase (beta-lactamase class C family)
MKKIVLAAIAAIVTSYAFSQDSTSRKLDELMTGYYDCGRFNGSVLVSQKGKILLEKGYGLKNADYKSANDDATVYQVASVTKTFTAAIILKLVELNKLSLQDKLTKFYPGFHNDITIEHLLHHTSGIRNITETDAGIPGADEKSLIAYLEKLDLDFPPGTSMHYSNSGYIILGHIITKVTGMNYWDAVRNYIFKPLKMNKSGFDFIHLPPQEKATGYDILTADKNQPSHIRDSTEPHAAGAIYSTVGDLYKWHRSLQGWSILSKKSLDKAYEPSPVKNYGYGWQIDSIFGKKMVSHSGGITGFGSNFARIPADDICIVLLSNKSGSTFEAINITERIVALLYGQPYQVPVKKKPVAVSEEILKTYEGTYEIQEPPLVVEIKLENGRLNAYPHRGPYSPLLALDKNRFYSETDEELEIIFQTNEAGRVYQLTVNMRDRTRIARKIK